MTTPHTKTIRLGLALLAMMLLMAGCAKKQTAKVAPPPPSPSASPLSLPAHITSATILTSPRADHPTVPAAKAAGSCHVNGELPDHSCTPGVADPNVTQDNIQQTICVSGYTTGIRSQYAPVAYTNALKKQQIDEYGYTDKSMGSYEEDHLISLELGGHPNDPRNLWPEKPHSPNPKDSTEGKLKRLVCSGQMDLKEAQRRISTDWTTALQKPYR